MPQRPTPGSNVTTWAQRMHDVVASLLPRPGPNLQAVRGFNGTTYSGRAGAASAVAADEHPWQPYPSPWLGIGGDPHAADRKKRFKLLRGKIAGRTPANMITHEFPAFGDVTDMEIEEADAVVTQVYCRVPISETRLGANDLTFARGLLHITEGDDLEEALGGDLPTPGEDGSLPSAIIVPLCEVLWWGGSLHFPPGQNKYLEIGVNSTASCGGLTREPFVL